MSQGFIIIENLDIPSETLEEVERQTKAGIARTHNGANWIMNNPYNPCKLDSAFALESFRKLAFLPEIREHVPIQGELDSYISKFFPMPPKKGFSVDWHQDNFYIRADSQRMISCDVFPHGATKDMGGLRVIPCSHTRSNVPFPHQKTSHGVFQWMNVSENHPQIVDIDLQKPFAILFDINLVHTCYKNTSDKYRPSIAWEYKERGYLPETYTGHQSQDIYEV